jgi:hypothetical protein
MELVGVTERYPSKYIARWNEAAAVAKWNREVGKGNKCPPGQDPSCR